VAGLRQNQPRYGIVIIIAVITHVIILRKFISGSVRVVSLYTTIRCHKLNQFYILFMLLNIKYKMEGVSCNSIGNDGIRIPKYTDN
jgi:hypothetical protein